MNDIKENSLIDNDSIRYIYYNDYIENRSFPFWINRNLPKLDKDYTDDELSDENISETVFNIVDNLVSLGGTLSKITKDEIKTTLEELGSKHSNYIPSDTQLLQLMKPNVNIMSFNEWNDHNFANDIANYFGLNTLPGFVIIHPNGNILHISKTRLGSFFKDLNEHVPDAEIDNILKSHKK